MSRIAKKPLAIPAGVEVRVDGNTVTVKGPLGELKQVLHERVSVTVDKDNSTFSVFVKDANDVGDKALWGLFARLIRNMVMGVSKYFEKTLELSGVGYRVNLQGTKLVFALGFSHPVEFPLPEGIKAEVNNNVIKIMGVDKHQVGQVAANIRALKKPEPYKGKGLKYSDEVIRRKAGKASAK
ncbi:MAG TPA: 50S ribosomal protein L6 [bacterium]|nr:50S ribosomal protein L6 [bacterium]